MKNQKISKLLSSINTSAKDVIFLNATLVEKLVGGLLSTNPSCTNYDCSGGHNTSCTNFSCEGDKLKNDVCYNY